MARWIDFLEGFQFKIQTRPGKEHENADFLSPLYTDCFCKHSKNFTATETADEALRDEPVKDWELFERCCREQADRRMRQERRNITLDRSRCVEHFKTLTTKSVKYP